MKNKELSKHQMRWVQKLADFNFKIMYQSDKQNIKINALTHQADFMLRNFNDERICYQWIVEIMFKSFNQRNLKLICMYCSLEIIITRH